jgi:hypothetical protein
MLYTSIGRQYETQMPDPTGGIHSVLYIEEDTCAAIGLLQ